MDSFPPAGIGHNRKRPLGAGSLAWLVGAVATGAAALVAAILAVVFAATVAVMALITGALLALGSLAYRARRRVRPANNNDLIEARHIGGHSWVAYGWDRAH